MFRGLGRGSRARWHRRGRHDRNQEASGPASQDAPIDVTAPTERHQSAGHGKGPGLGRGWRGRHGQRVGLGGEPGHGHGLGRRHRHGATDVAFEGPSLNDVPPGERCRIVALHGRGPIRHRLMDLGLVPNACLEVVRSAPLDDPVEVRLDDAFVTLRRAEAARIQVVSA